MSCGGLGVKDDGQLWKLATGLFFEDILGIM